MPLLHSLRPRRPFAWLAPIASLVAAALALPASAQPCDDRDPLRRAHFGDLHVHTSYSFDSYLFDNRNDPRDAYAFAKGAPKAIPPLDANGNPTQWLQLLRPLDFAAVTDHAELLGETSICLDPAHPQYASAACTLFRDDDAQAFALFAQALAQTSPSRLPFCGDGGVGCLAAAVSVWADLQAAAEEHYDRSSACAFTTFNAYEWTGSPGGDTLHRNVVFRSDVVPLLPISYIEAPSPTQLWDRLPQACANAGPACQAIAIPHNTNQSGGLAFPPLGSVDAATALRRQGIEPLVELVQHKGESECRPAVGSADELCSFEKTSAVPPANDAPLSYVRNALKEGLAIGDAVGVNPYAVGFVGATDTHNGTPGATREDGFLGHAGELDDSPTERLSGETKTFSPGGLTVLWAEENTRDALFEAMLRREAYATSGTRPLLRFFGGFGYPADLCDAADFVAQAYAGGVPMGGEIGPSPGAAPRFAVWALADPGPPGAPGTPLQRVQLVKGWLDAAGQTHETVVDVAGDANNGATVDPATCATTGPDFASLCAVWEDPDFDPTEPAFYYARVLENPTCRWSQVECVAAGVDCAQGAPPGFEACCDGSLPVAIQERAWSSPIWYRTHPPLAVPALPVARAAAGDPAPVSRVRAWAWLAALGLPFVAAARRLLRRSSPRPDRC